MSGPRNPRAVARSQRLRVEIRALLIAHPPLLPPLTAKAINARLPLHLRRDDDTIRWHVRQIRLAAELAALAADGFAPPEFIE